MTVRAVPDGKGGFRHEPAPYVPPARKGKRASAAAREPMKTVETGEVSAEQLRLLIERVERLEEERQGIANDIKDVYAEAKSTGFDPKTMKVIIRLRGMEKHHRDEADMLLDTYKQSLGI
jgi:uncharacterized protein (UPF0335 family)